MEITLICYAVLQEIISEEPISLEVPEGCTAEQIIELLNTAVEAEVNRIPTEQHTLSTKAKDAGNAAVLMAFINIVVE